MTSSIICSFGVRCVTVFKDENTKSPFREDFYTMGDTQGVSERLCKPDHIYMDCMGFGMGCSCLQMTFQVKPFAIYGAFTVTDNDFSLCSVANLRCVRTDLHQLLLATHILMILLPPAKEVCEGYVFTRVCLSTGGGGVPACIAGGIPACLAAGLGGGWYPSMPCRFPGPHPGGKLRVLARGVSRPTPGGCLQAHNEWCLQAHTQGVYTSMH